VLLQNIASISAGNDDSVGEMIADALDKVRGHNSIISRTADWQIKPLAHGSVAA
jgi:chaperonin GroEL (HSP60 family)